MDDPKEGGLLTPNGATGLPTGSAGLACVCVFIFAPTFYHMNILFSTKVSVSNNPFNEIIYIKYDLLSLIHLFSR